MDPGVDTVLENTAMAVAIDALEAWRENDHPRGPDGRWINKHLPPLHRTVGDEWPSGLSFSGSDFGGPRINARGGLPPLAAFTDEHAYWERYPEDHPDLPTMRWLDHAALRPIRRRVEARTPLEEWARDLTDEQWEAEYTALWARHALPVEWGGIPDQPLDEEELERFEALRHFDPDEDDPFLEAIIKVPTRSGNPNHDTETGRFAAKFVDTKNNRTLPSDVVPAAFEYKRARTQRDLRDPVQLAAVFDGFTHEATGLTVQVAQARRRGGVNGDTEVNLRIVDLSKPEGRQIQGLASRSVERRNDGALYAYHGYLQIDSEYRGKGFAAAFNAHAEQAYREGGITEVEVSTGMSDGGFVWAVAGFLVAPGSLSSISEREDATLSHEERTAVWAREMVDRVTDDRLRGDKKDPVATYLDELVAERPELTGLVAELEASLETLDFELPYQLAMFGIDQPFTGRDRQPTWLGKWILADAYKPGKSANWEGIRYL